MAPAPGETGETVEAVEAVGAGEPDGRDLSTEAVALGLWTERLAGIPTILEIPSDGPSPCRPEASRGRLPVDLPANLPAEAASSSASDRSRVPDVPSTSLLLAAFGLALGRLSGASSLLVGVGDRGNPVPVRVDIDDDLSPRAFAESVHASLEWSLRAGDVPFGELVARLGVERSDRFHPLVQVFFEAIDRTGRGTRDGGPGARRGDEAGAGRPCFDVAVELEGCGRSFAGHVDYARSLWDEDEAERFARTYAAAVEQLTEAVAATATATVTKTATATKTATDTSAAETATATATAADGAGATLADVRCLSAEARRMLDSVNATDHAFPDSSVDELFRIAAARWPGAEAVRDAETALTYAELAVAAAGQARLLRAAGVREGDAVLVCVPRSVAEAVAVLGTLWAGATYIGVDPAQPRAHVARIIAKASPTAAVASEDAAPRLAVHGVPLVGPWHPGRAVDGEVVPPARPDPDRLAYIAFTSGSSGEPKGVRIPHRGVIRLVHESAYLGLGPGDRFLRMAPLAFDASTIELWGSLLAGATLEVCPPELVAPNEIGAFIEERQLTSVFLTAGLFGLMQEFAPKSLGGLRHILTGGDVAPYEQVRRVLSDNPGLVVTNCYGPTENTVITTVHAVRDPGDVLGPVPIGKPIPGNRIHVLDKRARLLVPGAVGELYASGSGLASGYAKDQEETDRWFGRFSPDVPERLYRTGDLVRLDGAGRLHFLGRVDDQVKLRGFRIELHAISDALNALEGVEESLVTVTDGGSMDKRLIAAVRLTPGTEVTPVDLRGRLAEKLPSYMVPALWSVVDQLPLTANGKVDRRRLAAAARPAGSFARRGRP